MSTGAPWLDHVAMLGSADRPTSLGCVLAVAIALQACACASAPRPERRPPLPYFRTIRFADDEEILIGRVSAHDTTWRSTASVLELGGRVTATISDTLVVQPYYMTRRAAPAGERSTTIFRGAPATPDLVLIPMTSRVSLSEFRTPGAARRPLPVVPLVLGGLLILSLLRLDASLLSSL